MTVFTGTTEGCHRLGLRELLQRYADDQWVAAHMTNKQSAQSVLACFNRAVQQDLKLLDLECHDNAKAVP
jgi:hypothetical protein